MKVLRSSEMMDALIDYIVRVHGTQKRAAAHWGVSEAFVSSVKKGIKAPNKEMLKDIGLVPLKVFVRSDER